mgnify:FL=1
MKVCIFNVLCSLSVATTHCLFNLLAKKELCTPFGVRNPFALKDLFTAALMYRYAVRITHATISS